jgi:hypothetical protein
VVALMRRGEVWVARLNPNQGAEVGKLRPVVVIQADALTEAGLATLLVVPPPASAAAAPKPCGCRSPPATACCASAGRWQSNPEPWIATALAKAP